MKKLMGFEVEEAQEVMANCSNMLKRLNRAFVEEKANKPFESNLSDIK